MFRHIIRKELLETVRDGRFRWGGLQVGSLLLLALSAGWAQREELSRTHAAATEASMRHWLEQGDKNPHSAAHYGIYVFRPVSALSLVDQGVDPYMGITTWLEAHYQNPFEHRAVQDRPAMARFADVTAATTLQLLVPLLIILIAFQSVSGERERGTLAQLLSMGVRPRRLAWGKILGSVVSITLLLVPAAVIGALALLLAGPGGGAVGDESIRFLLLAGTYLIYFLTFALLVVGVSAIAPSSRSALAILLCIWIVNGLVVPRLSSDVASRHTPLPSSLEFQASVQQDMSDGFDGFPSQEVRQQALQDSVLLAHGVTELEELPFNFSGLSLQASEEFGDLVFDRRFGDLAERIRHQLEVHRRMGFLAPHLAVRSLSMALSGTDPVHHEHYATVAEEHRRLIQRIMNEDIMANSRYGDTYLADESLWAQIPDFEYQGPGVRWALAGHGTASGALFFWMLMGALLVRRGAASLSAAGR
jgi:ABC-2 type transport system permease protein